MCHKVGLNVKPCGWEPNILPNNYTAHIKKNTRYFLNTLFFKKSVIFFQIHVIFFIHVILKKYTLFFF